MKILRRITDTEYVLKYSRKYSSCFLYPFAYLICVILRIFWNPESISSAFLTERSIDNKHFNIYNNARPPESEVANSGDCCGHEAGEYHDVRVPAVYRHYLHYHMLRGAGRAVNEPSRSKFHSAHTLWLKSLWTSIPILLLPCLNAMPV